MPTFPVAFWLEVFPAPSLKLLFHQSHLCLIRLNQQQGNILSLEEWHWQVVDCQQRITLVNLCPGIHRNRVSFLPGSLYGAVFGLRMRIMLTSVFSCYKAELTLSKGLFSFSFRPASEEAGGAAGAVRGQNQDSWPKLAKGIFHHMVLSWTIKLEGLLLVGWLGTGGEQLRCASRAFSILLSLWLLLLFSFPVLLNCFYLNPRVFNPFLPIPVQRGGEQKAVWWLATCQDKPQHLSSQNTYCSAKTHKITVQLGKYSKLN